MGKVTFGEGGVTSGGETSGEYDIIIVDDI